MYVYVRNGMIIHKSLCIKYDDFLKWSTAMIVECNPTDNLIIEDWQIKIYERSNQFVEDSNKYALLKEKRKLENENARLKPIAEREVRNQLRKRSYEKLTDFDYKRYESYFNSK